MAKSPNAFRTISEAAAEVGAPQHVLRFWETKFAFVTPVKRAGGRRFYRLQDVVVLKAIRRLLHDEGLTIKGVQRLHKEQGPARLAAYGDPGATFSMDTQPGGEAGASNALEDRSKANVDEALRTVLADLDHARRTLDLRLNGTATS